MGGWSKRIRLCALVVAIAWPAAADTKFAARVMPSAALAPSDVVIQAFIEPNALNRLVTFVVESADFYTSSQVELDGDRAPRTKEVRFRGLPAGSYKVVVSLRGSQGERGFFESNLSLW